MASQGGVSRLTQMQMRFQQKQQQEREQRKIEMTGDVLTNNKSNSNNNNTSVNKITNSTIGPGKVRQMFDERRQRSTGIDKSYPLKPIPQRSSLGSASSRTATTINSTATVTATQKQSLSVSKQSSSSRASSSSSSVKESLSSSNRQYNDILNGNANIFNNNNNLEQDNIESETFPSEIRISSNNVSNGLQTLSSKLPNVGKHTSTTLNKNKIKMSDKNNNANNHTNPQSNSNLKLKPVVVKKIPPTEPLNNENKQNRRSNTSLNTLRTSMPTTVLSPKGNIKNLSSESMDNKIIKEKNLIANKANNNNLPTCHICHRGFNADRLEKHEQICEKTASKKRKKFDIVKHRVSGTDAEKYVKKSSKIGGGKLITTPAKTNIIKPTAKESNWRKTHEDFIKTIRAAKQMQTYLAKGGKLSDLPPPPPSENSDYIQCPHCNRKFNQNAAERHIPKCATFLHNKPKPVAPISLKKRY